MQIGDKVLLTKFYEDEQSERFGQVRERRQATIAGIYKHFVLVKYRKTREAFRYSDFERLLRRY